VGVEETIHDGAPGQPLAAIEPPQPRSGEPLFCRLTAAAIDPDGTRVAYAFTWARDDVPVPDGGFELPAGRTRKGDRWSCAVTASDGAARGPAGHVDVRVGNSPPSAPRVVLEPAAVEEGAPLRCRVVAPAADRDGDRVRTLFAWYRNGEEQSFASATDEVPGRLVRAGDRWRCVATATDGAASGPAGSSLETVVGGGRALANAR
jgi:hypothetical protein